MFEPKYPWSRYDRRMVSVIGVQAEFGRQDPEVQTTIKVPTARGPELDVEVLKLQ